MNHVIIILLLIANFAVSLWLLMRSLKRPLPSDGYCPTCPNPDQRQFCTACKSAEEYRLPTQAPKRDEERRDKKRR